MAKPIKETPVLRGKAAAQFLQRVKANEEHDHTAAYMRAKSVYNGFVAHSQRREQAHVQSHTR